MPYKNEYADMTAKDILELWKREREVGTFKELAELLSVSPNTLDTWKNRNQIPEKALLAYDRLRVYSNDEILDHSNSSFDDDIKRISAKMMGDSFIDNSDILKTPIISAKASAGNGSVHYDVETVGQLMIDKMMFKILPNIKNIRAVEVIGDSMYPTLKEGDYVVIEENGTFSGEGIYVLQFDSMLLVKRLQGSSRGIRVLSDNVYYKEDEYIPDDDQRTFNIIGKVVLRIQR